MKTKLYTTPTCKYCDDAKELFEEMGVEYQVIDLTKNKEAIEYIKGLNITQVPVIEIDDEIIVGFERERLLELINKINGK